MKRTQKLATYVVILIFGMAMFSTSCNKHPEHEPSTSELLVEVFEEAPVLDGTVDEMWEICQVLEGTATVPSAGSRGDADFNGDGSTAPTGGDVFDPYKGESNNFTLRAGVFGDMIYFLLEWDDTEDSKDRQSWYFDADTKRWEGQHKYANDDSDKFYEDKFAFLWAATDVAGFADNTCYATCHQGLSLTDPSQKTARHYTSNEGEIVDMWHWKRVRCSIDPTILDDQQMVYKPAGDAGTNGRTGDEGDAGYHNNKQELGITGTEDTVNVPLYVIPDGTDYYWITKTEIDNGTAKLVTAVDAEGILTYDGGTINPADGGYETKTGTKRFPSVWLENFTGSKKDVLCTAKHTGSGWIAEFSRKLNTGNADDVVFDITKEYPFGLALFNNAAIAHEIKTNLLMKFEEE